MLGAYAIITPAAHFPARDHGELNRYLRGEYGTTMGVAAFLAEAARVSEEMRPKRRRNLAVWIQALGAALGKAVSTRRSKAPTAEV